MAEEPFFWLVIMILDPETWPNLLRLGYDELLESNLSSGCSRDRVARVAVEHRGAFLVIGESGAVNALSSGRLRHRARDAIDLPAVGDWVELASAGPTSAVSIERVLPRRTSLVRRSAGDTSRPQLIAANVDVVLIVAAASAHQDARTRARGVNLRRLERYLVFVEQSGARPVIVINKADLLPDGDALVESVSRDLGGKMVLATSAVSGSGLDNLARLWSPRETVALVGSSGVGKSALTERLLGSERGLVGSLRADDERGRHTTTHRELYLLPTGGLLIDTPGMRELGLSSEDAEMDSAFEDVASFADQCRFRDCRHAEEPGCAVRAAIERGDLRRERLASRQKLEREIEHERRRLDPGARREAKRALRQRSRAIRAKLHRRG